MKEINRTNYEAYFIDYLEGNLEEGMIDGFIAFLKENPDLKQERELYEPISLEPESVAFSKKTELYKSNFDNNDAFDNAAIALLEGDLSADENEISMIISDDGEGFEIKQLRNGKYISSGNGVVNIQERVLFAGGEIEIDTSPGNGTTIIVNLPLRGK